jgi:hypothetical protein
MILHISFTVFFYNYHYNNMNRKMLYLVSLMVFLAIAASGYAAERTPYGDNPEGGAYGICNDKLTPEEAEMAIAKYFAARGYRAVHMRHKGRFVEADIYRDNRLYDKILFDRKTGRMRSIY